MPEMPSSVQHAKMGMDRVAPKKQAGAVLIASVIILGTGLESVKARASNKWALAFRHQRWLLQSFMRIRELTTMQGCRCRKSMTAVTCSAN